jgi:hypothetical protein
MTRSLSFAFAVGVALATPSAAFAEESVKPVHTHHHHPAQRGATVQQPSAPAPESAGSMFKPFAHPGDGDDDGMSRDPDDCMKGCIGGNPG